MNERQLWLRQIGGILRLELGKTLFSRRGWLVYLLALGPPAITWLHSVHVMVTGKRYCSMGEDMIAYAALFQLLYLRAVIFFGCLGIFGNLFRGEVLERTLHYYFLSPVRREVLLAGKFLAGLIAAVILFGLSAVLAYIGMAIHYGPVFQEFLWRGPGLAQLGWYATVTVLGCVGYGAVFLLAGVLYRNPMIFAAVVLAWEGINNFVPELLQKFSVIFYLKSLCPVQVPLRGPLALIAVIGEPVPAWLAIPGLLLVSFFLLYYAAARARRMEVSYTE